VVDAGAEGFCFCCGGGEAFRDFELGLLVDVLRLMMKNQAYLSETL
jgi:hypothetical protein